MKSPFVQYWINDYGIYGHATCGFLQPSQVSKKDSSESDESSSSEEEEDEPAKTPKKKVINCCLYLCYCLVTMGYLLVSTLLLIFRTHVFPVKQRFYCTAEQLRLEIWSQCL